MAERPMDHHTIEDLLPWYVTGRLTAEETARVDAHLKTCALCRAEVTRQRQLGRLVASVDLQAERDEEAWQALERKLTRPQPVWASLKARPFFPAWRPAVAAACLGGLVLLGLDWARTPGPAPDRFQTLSDPPQARDGVELRVQLVPEVDFDVLRGRLERLGIAPVPAPSATGLLRLTVHSAQAEDLAAAIRAEEGVAYVAMD